MATGCLLLKALKASPSGLVCLCGFLYSFAIARYSVGFPLQVTKVLPSNVLSQLECYLAYVYWGSCNPEKHTLMAAYVFVFLDGPEVSEFHETFFGQTLFVSLVNFLIESFQINTGQPFGYFCMFSELLLWHHSKSA